MRFLPAEEGKQGQAISNRTFRNGPDHKLANPIDQVQQRTAELQQLQDLRQ